MGNISLRSLRSSKSREQKKEALSCPFANNLSATVCAIVVFPVPANPFNQYTGDSLRSLVQSSIPSRIATRVPLRQPLRLPCRYSAPFVLRNLSRTVASAARCSYQAFAVENTGRRTCSDLGSEEKLLEWFGCRKEDAHHIFLPFIVDFLSQGDLFSVSTPTKFLEFRTNLIIEDGTT